MIAPGRISIGPGVRTWKCRNSGVMRCRLRASEKKRKTSSRGRGSHCHVVRVYDTANSQLPRPNSHGQTSMLRVKFPSNQLEFGGRALDLEWLAMMMSPALYLLADLVSGSRATIHHLPSRMGDVL